VKHSIVLRDTEDGISVQFLEEHEGLSRTDNGSLSGLVMIMLAGVLGELGCRRAMKLGGLACPVPSGLRFLKIEGIP
jgi:hypothetical protein